MPRYFFDAYDNDNIEVIDEEGTELTNLASVEDFALTVLAELAPTLTPPAGECRVSVRDNTSTIILEATLRLSLKHLVVRH